jgi:hypothetical protein
MVITNKNNLIFHLILKMSKKNNWIANSADQPYQTRSKGELSSHVVMKCRYICGIVKIGKQKTVLGIANLWTLIFHAVVVYDRWVFEGYSKIFLLSFYVDCFTFFSGKVYSLLYIFFWTNYTNLFWDPLK